MLQRRLLGRCLSRLSPNAAATTPAPPSRPRRRRCLALLASLACMVAFCEYLVYYAVLLSCTWPQLPGESPLAPSSRSEGIRVLLLADTHLLGWRQGHWFDRLRREWQMERAFQTSLFLHQPQLVVVLGDLLDEGKWAEDTEFQHHVARFRRMFRTPESTRLLVVAGNHDIGFHYDVTRRKAERMEAAFQLPAVQLVTIGTVNFVQVNSVAFEGDGCFLCAAARAQLAEVSNRLRCAFGVRVGDACPQQLPPATAPILLGHYPLVRPDETVCQRRPGEDQADAAPPGPARLQPLRPRWDCLSREASDQLANALRPRLAFTGHTHWACERQLTLAGHNLTEFTLPSFSWRYINSPSFLLARIGGRSHAVAKCRMPRESTVIAVYYYGVSMLALWFFWPCLTALVRRLCCWRPWRESDKHL